MARNIKKVAAAQLTPVFLDKERTVEKACNAIKEAGGKGAELIVFPEAFISGYPDWVWLVPNSKGAELNELYLRLVENAVSIPDAFTIKLCKAAKEAKINVVIGLHERNSETSNTSLFNSLLFIDHNGKILGKHRKLIPTGGERLVWSRGDGSTLSSYDTSVGKIAGLICWENYMPLARTAIYEMGTQILTSPTWDKSPNWIQSMQHIAREGGLFVISTCMALKMDNIPDEFEFKNLYPKDREWINVGNSLIIAPNGKIIAGPLEAEEGILYADINLQDIIKAKRMFDVVGHYARPDVFNFKFSH
ncbi:MAG: carbon-nitrogen hydrolase family protein [Bacteroidota bacterium]|uniref:Carbon-nitrogen hydrolase family protein n=1 Tax=Flagellimonas profundi TaxID=2915620 RepID=A0ABS3FGI2_9FLAO|nr:carbon-nitrogen hydrolase family protein [Allomuricauda profundi]MBO0342274.1 carbon-nitrogen hydrolase family protein [Allomuricauda profundi]MEC7772830.1 carbon-nitrogen hydrolase family protein [Bacteroidota bacterium]